MRASRLLTSALVAAALWAAGVGTSLPAASTDPGADHSTGARIAMGDALVGSEALLAAPPVAPIAGVEDSGRAPAPARRMHRIARVVAPQPAHAARVAALMVSRLSFAGDLDAARLGWFSFGSTAPPPFQG